MPVSELQLSAVQSLDSDFTTEELNERLAEITRKFNRVTGAINNSDLVKSNVALDSLIEPSCEVGQPVFYNTATNRFEKSRIDLLSSGSGRLYASPSSEAWGIVLRKCSLTRADVLLSGLAKVSLVASTGVDSPSGKFYLSKVAGELVSTPDHSLIAPVLLATGGGEVLFRPWFADTFPRYMPSMVELSKNPAGSVTIVGGKQVFISTNVAINGWLPATHFSLQDVAPVGAKYGYNMPQLLQLSEAWPPVNPAAAKLYIEAGGTLSKGSRVLLGDDTERLLINEDGIWWMTDNATQVPWNFAVDGQSTGVNPLAIAQRFVLEADLVIYGDNNISGVSSLGSVVPWLRFNKSSTSNEATIGDLQLAIIDNLLMTENIVSSTTALGQIVNGQFQRVSNVSGIRPGNNAVSLSGTKIGNSYVGDVTISVVVARDIDLLPVDTQLFGATTESYAEVMAIGLPAGCDTRFVNAFHIPSSVPADSNIVFELWLSSQTALTLPNGLTMKSRVFANPTGTPLPVADVPTAVDLVLEYTAGVIIPAGKYAKFLTQPVTVAGGDSVYIEIARTGSTDGVSSEVHVIKMVGRFVSEV